MRSLWINFLIIILALGSCVTYRYEGDKSFKTKQIGECKLPVLYSPPNYEYEEIGLCSGKGLKFVGDGSNAAYSQVEKCACKYGGDAVLIFNRRMNEHYMVDASGSGRISKSGISMDGIVIRKILINH
jgi:hypothetical protein